MELKKRNFRKERIGIVTSNSMDKSLVVSVERRIRHRIYGKFIKKTTKFYQDAWLRKSENAKGVVQEDQPPLVLNVIYGEPFLSQRDAHLHLFAIICS